MANRDITVISSQPEPASKKPPRIIKLSNFDPTEQPTATIDNQTTAPWNCDRGGEFLWKSLLRVSHDSSLCDGGREGTR